MAAKHWAENTFMVTHGKVPVGTFDKHPSNQYTSGYCTTCGADMLYNPQSSKVEHLNSHFEARRLKLMVKVKRS